MAEHTESRAAAPERPAQQPSGAAKAAVVKARNAEPESIVPAEGSTMLVPPMPQEAGGAPAEPDESTAADHEKASSKTEGEDPANRSVDTVVVESALGEGRVALYERHPDHPGGEAFVGPGEQVEVARTGAVEARLKAGYLREV